MDIVNFSPLNPIFSFAETECGQGSSRCYWFLFPLLHHQVWELCWELLLSAFPFPDTKEGWANNCWTSLEKVLFFCFFSESCLWIQFVFDAIATDPKKKQSMRKKFCLPVVGGCSSRNLWLTYQLGIRERNWWWFYWYFRKLFEHGCPCFPVEPSFLRVPEGVLGKRSYCLSSATSTHCPLDALPGCSGLQQRYHGDLAKPTSLPGLHLFRHSVKSSYKGKFGEIASIHLL